MATLQEILAGRLEERRSAALYRQRRTLHSPQQPRVNVEGKSLLSFCSNDYLGLANHPAVIGSFKQALDEFGAGSGASHLVSGHSLPHHALEAELAAFTGRSRALVFSSGYMANVGILTALLGKQDQVFEDRLNHASLLDGGLFSGARFKRYPHLDSRSLAAQLGKHSNEDGLRCIVTDGVFSMDGDVAPLPQLLAVAAQHNAVLMLDDAHGFGCLGSTGGGLAQAVAETGITVNEHNLPILVGTFGKAFGTAGAFVAGSDELIESLIQFCRPYIYTTALPPAVAAATRTSLALIQQEHWRREHLQHLIQRFRTGCLQLGYSLTDSHTPIQGLLLGEAGVALAASRALEAAGLLVTAIRPPTVPAGTARLRITFSATHTETDVDLLLDALATLSTVAAAGEQA
jgi:8-amino-7-oxononanoate synthase